MRDRVPFGARGHFLSVVCGADLLKTKVSSLAGPSLKSTPAS